MSKRPPARVKQAHSTNTEPRGESAGIAENFYEEANSPLPSILFGPLRPADRSRRAGPENLSCNEYNEYKEHAFSSPPHLSPHNSATAAFALINELITPLPPPDPLLSTWEALENHIGT